MAERARIGSIAGGVLLGLLVACMTAWGALALYYSDLENGSLRTALAGGFSLAGLAAIVGVFMRGWRGKSILGFLILFAVLIAWWSAIEPSNERIWQTDVARLAHADIQGDLVTVHNIRNFDYRSETDFTPAYYDKTFDLRKLQSVDLIAVYWMGPAIAHTFVSFGFEGGDHLAISIETRKEKSEAYSTIKGFFKQYELYYVVADERDAIRLRTNYRLNPPEEVYVYRVYAPIENGRRVFLEYMHKISKLKEEPEFYNTLIDNCTTGIWMNARINPGHPSLSWKILASGYVPEYLYKIGRLAPGPSFSELQRLGHINSRAREADQAADFSRRIRIGVPGMHLDAEPVP
jgi:hypothetical protein